MTAGTVVGAALLLVWGIFALRGARRKKGGCCGDCIRCAGACGTCSVPKKAARKEPK